MQKGTIRFKQVQSLVSEKNILGLGALVGVPFEVLSQINPGGQPEFEEAGQES